MPLSSESSSCRIEWRASPLLCACLVLLTSLAVLSIWLSALPVGARVACGLLASWHGQQLARREFSRRSFSLEWRSGEPGFAMVFPDRTLALSAATVRIRGPLGCVSGLDARKRRFRLFWGPDTLSASDRRLLRLASAATTLDPDAALATVPA